MNPHYERYLFRKYEPLYQGHKLPVTQNLMAFGFEHGDGWFNIINELSYQLCHDWLFEKNAYEAIKGREGQLKYPKQEEGKYNPIITDSMIDAKLHDMEIERKKIPLVFQVKEKFGALRYYVGSATDEQHGLINMACALSAVTCEICGAPGKINSYGWLRCLCKKHRKEHEG